MMYEHGLAPTEYEAPPKPITNADRFKTMSNKALSEFLYDVWIGRFGCLGLCKECTKSGKENCSKCWENWLGEEYKGVRTHDEELQADREYQAATEYQEHCERYEPTYNPEDGSM